MGVGHRCEVDESRGTDVEGGGERGCGRGLQWRCVERSLGLNAVESLMKV